MARLTRRSRTRPQALAALIRTSDGDLRRAITYLQSASRLAAATGEPISPVGVQEIGGVVPDGVMSEFGRALGVRHDHDDDGGDVEMKPAAGSGVGAFDRVREAVEKVSREGYSAVQVLSQVRPGPFFSTSRSLSLALHVLTLACSPARSCTTSSSSTRSCRRAQRRASRSTSGWRTRR